MQQKQKQPGKWMMHYVQSPDLWLSIEDSEFAGTQRQRRRRDLQLRRRHESHRHNFHRNSAEGSGGVMYLRLMRRLIAEGGAFEENEAILMLECFAAIRPISAWSRRVFRKNSAEQSGGAIYVQRVKHDC